MKTLDEVPPAWSQKITDASKRFKIVLDGAAVLDKETGLVWARSPETSNWSWYISYHQAHYKEIGGRKGWRLPTVEELASLIDNSVSGAPKLPAGHPFTNVDSDDYYWTSTAGVPDSSSNYFAWAVSFKASGQISYINKESEVLARMWCVRGGHSYDGRGQ
jgi:hypothetical protein